MGVSFIALGLVGLLFVCLVAAIVAIATKRPMVAVAIGATVVILFGGLVMLKVASAVAMRPSHTIAFGPPNSFSSGMGSVTFSDGQAFGGGGGYTTHTWFRFSTVPIFLLLGAGAAIAMLVARRACGRRPAGSGSNWWPALLILPLGILFLLGGIRYSRESSSNTKTATFEETPSFDQFHTFAMQSQAQTAEQMRQAQNKFADQTREAQTRFADQTRQARERYSEQVRQAQGAQAAVSAQERLAEQTREAETRYAEQTRQAQERFSEQMRQAQGAQASVSAQAKAKEAMLSNQKAMAAVQQQIAHMNIYALMDMFDKPKIDLQPANPAAPPPPVAPAPQANPPVVAQVVSTKIIPAAENVAVKETAEAEVEPSEAKAKQNPKLPKEQATVAQSTQKPEKQDQSLPAWANEAPHPYQPNAWRETISTDEYATAEECRQATDIYLLYKAYDRLQTLLDRPNLDTRLPSLTFRQGMIAADGNMIYDKSQPWYWNDNRISQLNRMGIGIDYLRGRIVRDQYLAQTKNRFVAEGLEPMVKQYTLIEFNKETDDYLRQHWQALARQERFVVVGVGAGSVVSLLGFVFGLLKIDTWTKGYYTKRLFIGVPAAIIGGILATSFLIEVLT